MKTVPVPVLIGFSLFGLSISALKAEDLTNSTDAIRPTDSVYWTNAQTVQKCIANTLLTPYHSYRTKIDASSSFAWYNASHIYADAAMVAHGDSDSAASMKSTFSWMKHFWDTSDPKGGYFAAADIKGDNPGGGKYVDDNSLIGNVFLDCYDVTPDNDTIKTKYLDAAIAAADWLMHGGEWDDTYGGGFWWNMTRKNKPTQSNGLAMQLFLRLYKITGKNEYKDWANSVKDWLETKMYNKADGLYVWQITADGTNPAEFTYDNGIMIEADLLYAQVMSDDTYLTKAQDIAKGMDAKLWNDKYGSYYMATNAGSVNPCWCGWASQSLIRLYQVDGNTKWLDHAKRNIDYINKYLKNDSLPGSYYKFCNMDGSQVVKTMEGVDQAWMQRIQAMMANYR
jgi:hypothetical protein